MRRLYEWTGINYEEMNQKNWEMCRRVITIKELYPWNFKCYELPLSVALEEETLQSHKRGNLLWKINAAQLTHFLLLKSIFSISLYSFPSLCSSSSFYYWHCAHFYSGKKKNIFNLTALIRKCSPLTTGLFPHMTVILHVTLFLNDEELLAHLLRLTGLISQL